MAESRNYLADAIRGAISAVEHGTVKESLGRYFDFAKNNPGVLVDILPSTSVGASTIKAATGATRAVKQAADEVKSVGGVAIILVTAAIFFGAIAALRVTSKG